MYEHFFVVANIAERLGISYCDTGGSPAFVSVVRMTNDRRLHRSITSLIVIKARSQSKILIERKAG